MINARKTIGGNRCPLWSRMPRLALVVLLACVVMISYGCATVKTLSMQDSRLIPGSAGTSGPPVTLLPVQETLESDAARSDPTYLGSGVYTLGLLIIIPFPPDMVEFHSDRPRTDIVRSAALARLQSLGVPATVQASGGLDQLKGLPEDHLGVVLRLRKLDVETAGGKLSPNSIVIVNMVTFFGQAADVILDCQLWQPGGTAPLWQGTGEGKASAETEFGGSVVQKAVSEAVSQCIDKSGITETRIKLNKQRYAKLMTTGREQATGGNSVKALDLYVQAYAAAWAFEDGLDATKTMAQLIQGMQIQPVLPEEVRKYTVQAEAAVREKNFIDAIARYEKALSLAPWWAEGHFNRGLILSEVGDLKTAVAEMKRYLALSPNAPNARVVQDKIYSWER